MTTNAFMNPPRTLVVRRAMARRRSAAVGAEAAAGMPRTVRQEKTSAKVTAAWMMMVMTTQHPRQGNNANQLAVTAKKLAMEW
jgi:uncharacterized membrane protein